jgi:uncharacterized protein YndB with AHSA1/START domain
VTNEPLGTLSAQGATRTVEHVHHLAAKVPVVWESITVPDQICAWMRTTSTILEPRVGGNVHIVWSPTSDSKGTVMIFDVRKTLAFTWHEERGHSMVRFDLVARDDETTLTLRHRDISPDQLPGIAAGWHTHLEFLAAVLARDSFDFDARFDELLPQYQELTATL